MQTKLCIIHAVISWASHPIMMAAGNDGGVQYLAGVHFLDDRLASTASTPLTLGHAFYDIFDRLTIAERNAVARCLIGFWGTFPYMCPGIWVTGGGLRPWLFDLHLA